jgi:hypothetical protein
MPPSRAATDNQEVLMPDSYRKARPHPAIMSPKARDNGREPRERNAVDRHLTGQRGDDHGRSLDMLDAEPVRALPCGGRCERFGVQGCHSPRCRVGGE